MFKNGNTFPIRLALILIAVIIASNCGSWARAEDGKSTDESGIARAKGLDSAERDAIYEGLRLHPDYLYPGKVLSKDPYAVVTAYDAEDLQAQAKIKIWTGVFVRTGSSLATLWDELWVGESGGITLHATDTHVELKDYFLAESQKAYQAADYLGIAPWPADIPTDKEAKARRIVSVPSDGAFNFYQMAFSKSSLLLTRTPEVVKPASSVPDFSGLTDLPGDVAGHWAKDPILHLLRGRIIQGYEDHTVRPDKKLSRAEFIAILARSLKLTGKKGIHSQFSDVNGHWSEPEVSAAELTGILPLNAPDGKFQPDALIKRIEMVEWIDRAAGAATTGLPAMDSLFRDLKGVTDAHKKSLARVYAMGIVGGYPDGTFKPDNSLTRAEAFKVISALLELIKR